MHPRGQGGIPLEELEKNAYMVKKAGFPELNGVDQLGVSNEKGSVGFEIQLQFKGKPCDANDAKIVVRAQALTSGQA